MLVDIYRQMRNATGYSLDGLRYLMDSEFAARLEIYAFIWIICLLLFLQAPLGVLVTTTILFCVLIAVEALNTAIEVLVDRVSPEISETGKRGKDLGSFSVMCLIVANVVNFLYALSQCDWSIAGRAIATSAGAIFASCLLLYVAIYALARRAPVSAAYARLVIAICTLCFAGIAIHIGTRISGGLPVLLIWAFAFASLSIAVLSFIYDLIRGQKYRMSKKVLAFIKRRVKLAKPGEGVGAVRSASAQRSGIFYMALPALVLALFVNPLGQDIVTAILSDGVGVL